LREARCCLIAFALLITVTIFSSFSH